MHISIIKEKGKKKNSGGARIMDSNSEARSSFSARWVVEGIH
jgi:hypothetical protein